jgi:hypothetical protein
LIKFCREDSDPKVALAALEALGLESLRKRELTKLAASKHAQIRIVTIERLPRHAVLNLCCSDSSDEVRTTAWHKLEPQLTVDESDTLSRSSFGDVRLNVVRKNKVPESRLNWLRWRDPSPDVRQEAFERAPGEAGWLTRWRMLRSPYVDVRVRMVQSNNLSKARLAKIYSQDKDEAVRQAAWHQLFKGLPDQEAEAVLEKDRLTLRPLVVKSSHFPRERLVELCRNDWQTAVRENAWKKLRAQLNPSEALRLSGSQYGEVRLWVIQSGVLSREQVVELCRSDRYRPASIAAWEFLRNELTAVEAEKVSRSPNSNIRIKAIDSGLLPPARLRELSTDSIVTVREAARRQLQQPEYSAG